MIVLSHTGSMPKYEIHWKDFNSPLVRNEIWAGFVYFWPKLLGLPFCAMGIRSERDAIAYFGDMPAARQVQVVLADRIARDSAYLANLIMLAEQQGKALNRFTESIHRADLRRWNTSRLIAVYKQFANLQTRQYAVGIPLVALDVSFGPKSLDSLIKEILSKKLRGKAFDEAYAAFTAPTRDSFARQQERELLKIYARNQNAWSTLLPRHTCKWAWVYYVYAGPAWEEKDFAAILNDWARQHVKPRGLLLKWANERAEVIRTQKRYLRILKLSKTERRILELAGLTVWSKPRRKDYQSKSYWHMEKWYREVARRLGISLREVRSMSQRMLYQSLSTGHVDTRKIQELYNYHVVVPGPRALTVLTGSKARQFMRKVKEEKVKVHGRVFTGSPACPGRAVGTVRIVNSPEDMPKMKQGDILVSVSTTPSIVPAMRKAAAILADEGGLTCHAAIVSRELRIPCIVGFNVITSALKDGDRVEVDATKGIVRKL